MKIMESLTWNNCIQISAQKERNEAMVYVAVNFSNGYVVALCPVFFIEEIAT